MTEYISKTHMIFTNDKGDVLHDIKDVKNLHCDGTFDVGCSGCPVYEKVIQDNEVCFGWVQEHPEEAARLMGWDVADEEPDIVRRDKQNQPTNCTREAILESARRCVCGDRDNIYGGPEDSFREIAGAWAWYLKDTCCGGDVTLLPEDVAAMMCLFKLARIKTAETFSRDSWVDLCGYGACGGELQGP